jgi:ketosteroid isomerase-like protein
MDINQPAIVAEVTALYQQYETALCNNDLATMDALFWDSPEVIRFGATENLYGIEAIRAFRKARGSATLRIQRDVKNLKVLAIGSDVAMVTLEFYGGVVGKPANTGRQTQLWHRFPDVGWRIVSAHVSWLPMQ